jgi:hypothetical protein
MIQNPQVIDYLKKLDDLRELQGCIYAFLDYKAVLAQRSLFVQRSLIKFYAFLMKFFK